MTNIPTDIMYLKRSRVEELKHQKETGITIEYRRVGECVWSLSNTKFDYEGLNMSSQRYNGWVYGTHNSQDQNPWCEESLRPIPPEEQNGIDASEYIKNLTGVPV